MRFTSSSPLAPMRHRACFLSIEAATTNMIKAGTSRAGQVIKLTTTSTMPVVARMIERRLYSFALLRVSKSPMVYGVGGVVLMVFDELPVFFHTGERERS